MRPTFLLIPILAGLFATTPAAANRPKTVFLMVDEQRRAEFNHLPDGRKATGSPLNLTPNIDRLVMDGTVLDGLHVPTPICIPSHFTALTGLFPNRVTKPAPLEGVAAEGIHNVYQSAQIIPETPTLPEYRRAAGDFTGAIGKNQVIEEGQEWRRPPLDADSRSPGVRACRQAGFDFADRLAHGNLHTAATRDRHHHSLEWMVEGAFDSLAHAGNRPSFLHFATTLPHSPSASGTGWRTNDPHAANEGSSYSRTRQSRDRFPFRPLS